MKVTRRRKHQSEIAIFVVEAEIAMRCTNAATSFLIIKWHRDLVENTDLGDVKVRLDDIPTAENSDLAVAETLDIDVREC